MTALNDAKRVKTLHYETLFAKPNVVGVGVGYKDVRGEQTGEVCVKVLVRRKLPRAALTSADMVPRELDGIRTDVIQVGDLRALLSPTDRWRPAPGGVSIGHYRITAGTLGCVVRDRESGERLILSNNHVLANSNDAQHGDPILQPGPADGGQVETDTLAKLARFCPIQFDTTPGTCDLAKGYALLGNAIAQAVGSSHRLDVKRVSRAVNHVDAAVARPVTDSDVLDRILTIDNVPGTLPAELGMPLCKSGRTTGFTTGQVRVLDATVTISYGELRTATFEEQIITGPMSQGGDSGSLVVAKDSRNAVGLLFAGSEQSTVLNPIQAVLDCLNVTIGI
ncbi:MAG: hypothetical protein GXP40_13055 [Chloroflexi bacterium]|nr:hypothetical protein [Chloroflexota bacterium]